MLTDAAATGLFLLYLKYTVFPGFHMSVVGTYKVYEVHGTSDW